jgi:hypothetical protein
MTDTYILDADKRPVSVLRRIRREEAVAVKASPSNH